MIVTGTGTVTMTVTGTGTVIVLVTLTDTDTDTVYLRICMGHQAPHGSTDPVGEPLGVLEQGHQQAHEPRHK